MTDVEREWKEAHATLQRLGGSDPLHMRRGAEQLFALAGAKLVTEHGSMRSNKKYRL